MFAGSSRHTLLFIDRDRGVRADWNGSRIESHKIQPRSFEVDVPMMVELLLNASGAAKPGTVWVLSSEWWSGAVSVPASDLAGLSEEETTRALAYEAESLSGASAFDSAAAYKATGSQDGLREYWLTLIPSSARTAIEQAIAARGGKLGGLLHPAGVPLAWNERLGDSMRGECWSGLNLGVTGEGKNAVYRFVRNEREAAEWQAQLAAGGSPIGRSTLFRLSDEETLLAWLAAWASALARGECDVPLVRGAPKTTPDGVYAALAIILFALVVGGIAWDRSGLLASIAANEKQVAEFQGRKSQFDAAKKAIDEREKKLNEKAPFNAKFVAETRELESLFEAHVSRWPALLRVLAACAHDDLVIQEIKAEQNDVTIVGASLNVARAQEFAADTARELRPLGWIVSPAHKTVDDRLHTFTWKLTETIPAAKRVNDDSLTAKRPAREAQP